MLKEIKVKFFIFKVSRCFFDEIFFLDVVLQFFFFYFVSYDIIEVFTEIVKLSEMQYRFIVVKENRIQLGIEIRLGMCGLVDSDRNRGIFDRFRLLFQYQIVEDQEKNF